MKDQERERVRMELELRKLEKLALDCPSVHDAVHEAESFISEVSNWMENASILEKKLLIPKVGQGIIVNRGADLLELTLSVLPRTNNPILELILQDGVFQSKCARNKICAQVTTWTRRFNLRLYEGGGALPASRYGKLDQGGRLVLSRFLSDLGVCPGNCGLMLLESERLSGRSGRVCEEGE